MNPALRLAGVHKRFGQTIAVDNLDLVVPAGGLYGVIGPNGAGKTTTIRMIMSILFPDAGELSVLGHRSALEALSSTSRSAASTPSARACCATSSSPNSGVERRSCFRLT